MGEMSYKCSQCDYTCTRVTNLHQGGITCGAIDEPRKSSKAIDGRVIINLRNKNVVILRFRDKNVVISRFRDKTAYVWMGILPLKKLSLIHI